MHIENILVNKLSLNEFTCYATNHNTIPTFLTTTIGGIRIYKDYNIYITTERTDIMLQENLIMLRSLAGKTQEDIAEVIGISRQAYAKWERGV